MLETLQQLDQQLLLTLNGLHSPYWDSFINRPVKSHIKLSQ